MEEWQKSHIKKNLPALIQNTICGALLKAGLKAKELLSDEEDQRITVVGRNHGCYDEAKQLYEIMLTKPGGYNGLIDVLKETRQQEAVNILQDGLSGQTEAFSDPTKHLMNLSIQISTHIKCFKDVFPNITEEDAMQLLGDADLKKELQDMVQNASMVLKIDGDLPMPQELYIPRLISNRLQLNPRIFTLDQCEDIFVFKNIGRSELAKLVAPYATRSSENQRSEITCRHIYLDDEEDWEDLVDATESPLHLVSKENDEYILEVTTKVTDVLQNNSSREGRTKDFSVTEDEFVNQLISNNDSRGALVCDVPGMGKTWLMQSLAANMQAKTEKFVVFFIELSSFSKGLSKRNSNPAGNKELLTVLNYVCKSSLVCEILSQHSKNNMLKLMFVFDGYDEISQEDTEEAKKNLIALSKLDHVRMIISSRPNMRATLQQCFSLISYDILPFRIDQQVHSIVEQWMIVYPEHKLAKNKLEEFALQCIKSVKTIQKDNQWDFLGVPLKCRILATVNEKEAKRLCKQKPNRPINFAEKTNIKSVFDLYTKFVDALVHKSAQNVSKRARVDFVSGVLAYHTHMALDLLFPEISTVYLNNHNIEDSMEETIRSLGLVRFNHSQQSLEFIHRTFAEYFVGKFFADFWNNVEGYSVLYVAKVGFYFVWNVLKIKGNYSRSAKWNNLFIYITRRSSDFRIKGILDSHLGSFHFKHSQILSFMNCYVQNLKFSTSVKRFESAVLYVEPGSTISGNSLKSVDSHTKVQNRRALRRQLASSALVTMIAFINERHTNILSLYIQILMSFIKLSERPHLLAPQILEKPKLDLHFGAACLLCTVAISNFPENAVDVFKLFNDSRRNYLLTFCKSYPREYWSPLECAIHKGDLDMVVYFSDKVKPPLDRTFIACIEPNFMLITEDPNMDLGIKIMDVALGNNDYVTHFLRSGNLCHLSRLCRTTNSQFSYRLMTVFIKNYKHDMTSFSRKNKQFMIEISLDFTTDEETISLLLALCRKRPEEILKFHSGPDLFSPADVVVNELDKAQVRNVFSGLILPNNAFSNCLKVDTLKIFVDILPNLTSCTEYKRNYLHFAASNGNINWIKFLINSGHDLNQQDWEGFTPLMYATRSKNLQIPILNITRVFVENGADVYAKDDRGRTVAHHIIDEWMKFKMEDICDWVSYMLEKGHSQLWEIKNVWGTTPRDMLIKKAGKNNPLTSEVFRLLDMNSTKIK